MIDKDLWNELWDSGTDYEPFSEETIKVMTTPKMPANSIAITEDQLKNEIKSIDNKLYSEYYDMDCEDLLEDLQDNPHGKFLLFRLYHEYGVVDSKDPSGCGSCKVYEYNQNHREIYLIEHNGKKFMFHGYDITIISLYDDSQILFGGKEEITIYNTEKQTLTRLN
jgi:hypothetical protein